MNGSEVPLGLLGAGGHAREIACYAGRPIAFYAVEAPYLGGFNGSIDIEGASVRQCGTDVVAAVGAPGLRRRLVERWAGNRYAVVVAASAWVGAGNKLAPGVVIAPQAAVTTGCVLGAHSQVNVGASISHDCVLGEFVTVGPGARLSGSCIVGSGVLLGPGASVVPGVRLADGVVVGAGAVVIGDVAEENAVLVGVPARPIRVGEEWLNEL